MVGGFEKGEFHESLHYIRSNLVWAMIKLLSQSDRLYQTEILYKKPGYWFNAT